MIFPSAPLSEIVTGVPFFTAGTATEIVAFGLIVCVEDFVVVVICLVEAVA